MGGGYEASVTCYSQVGGYPAYKDVGVKWLVRGLFGDVMQRCVYIDAVIKI